jgi:hypothetical protein
MTSDELMQLIKEAFEYNMTGVHTSFPGVVESYDPKTRRAVIQPSLKRKLPDGSFQALPVIMDVPVRFPGTKKYTIHIPLEKGDEVEVNVCERATDTWRDSGSKDIEDTDPRRFDLNDCYCSPGLQPQEFIAVEDAGLNIVHKTGYNGDFISRVTMDDNKVEIKYKEKADITLTDDRILAVTEKCSFEMTKENIRMEHGRDLFQMNGPVSLVSKQTDLLKISNALGSLGGIVNDILDALIQLKVMGPIAHPFLWVIPKILPIKLRWNMVFKK